MLKRTYKNCTFIGCSNVIKGIHVEMQELSFICNEPYGYSEGKQAISVWVSPARLEKLLEYKVKEPLMVGSNYDLVYQDYQDNHKLHLSAIYKK